MEACREYLESRGVEVDYLEYSEFPEDTSLLIARDYYYIIIDLDETQDKLPVTLSKKELRTGLGMPVYCIRCHLGGYKDRRGRYYNPPHERRYQEIFKLIHGTPRWKRTTYLYYDLNTEHCQLL